MKRHHASGSILTLVLLGLLAAGILATIAYGSYYQIARGTQDTVIRANSSALLTQAAYTLATEAVDTDSDGTAEPLAGLVPLGDGWEIPATSGAPKADAWGSSIKYCPWDNGGITASSGRLAGDNPATQGSIQFALVSAGADKTFNTTCSQAKTGALGDDGVRTKSVSQINQGVGGTFYYGDPVANVSALPVTDAPAGKMRVTLDTQITYLWNGVAWAPLTATAALVVVAGDTCSLYPSGALARDTADNLYMCSVAKVWKKVQ